VGPIGSKPGKTTESGDRAVSDVRDSGPASGTPAGPSYPKSDDDLPDPLEVGEDG
jgi:hypothetical protein